MRREPLNTAVPSGVDVRLHAKAIQQVRDAVQAGDRQIPTDVIREVISQDWTKMVSSGLPPEGAVPCFVDANELRSLRDDQNLNYVWEGLRGHLGLGRETEYLAVVADPRGCVVWVDGDRAALQQTARFGFSAGSLWGSTGTNGIRLAIASGKPVQLYHAEHWVHFQQRWTCSAVPIMEPGSRRLLAVINVTYEWERVHADTLKWLYEIAGHIEDGLPAARHRTDWPLLMAATGRLERIKRSALVVDRHGVVVAAHGWSMPQGTRLDLPAGEIEESGQTFLPALGWCLLEPLPKLGWLVRLAEVEDEAPPIVVDLVMTPPGGPLITVTGPSVSWSSSIRPLHARILDILAERPGGLSPAELAAQIYSPATRTSPCPEISKLRAELGGLLRPTSHKSGGNKYRLRANVCVNVVSG